MEPDGSITFSPNRPPAGVDFDVVDAGRPDPGAAAIVRSPVAPPAPDAPDPFGPGAPDVAAASDAAPAAVAPPEPGVSYAPPPLGAAVAVGGPGLDPASENAPGVPDAAPDARAPASDAAPTANDPTDARRRAQCRELEKRVVSLERSLMIEMPPERMDDTVVSMARYQDSLDAHCRR